MNALNEVALIGAVTVISFDAVAAVTSRATGVAYSRFTLGSCIIYAGVGYLAARSALQGQLGTSALAGIIVGFTDATVGWTLSWIIGPGRRLRGLSFKSWLFTAVFVISLSSGLAILGGAVAVLSNGRGRLGGL